VGLRQIQAKALAAARKAIAATRPKFKLESSNSDVKDVFWGARTFCCA